LAYFPFPDVFTGFELICDSFENVKARAGDVHPLLFQNKKAAVNSRPKYTNSCLRVDYVVASSCLGNVTVSSDQIYLLSPQRCFSYLDLSNSRTRSVIYFELIVCTLLLK
jgi:hypothetical protein